MMENTDANPGKTAGSTSRLPVFDANTCPEDMEKMIKNTELASNFLKAISHEGRLMILCHLVSGEKSVTDLEDLLSSSDNRRMRM